MKRLALIFPILLLAQIALGETKDSDEPNAAGLFSRGRTELTVGGGYGTFDNNGYLLLLLGGNYYLRDGVSAGLTTEAWLGSQPQVYDVSPQIRDVLLNVPWTYKPYVGIFYRRTAYSRTFKPLDSIGGRAGLVFPLNSRSYVTAGLAYEHYSACSTAVYSSCDGTYPEVGLAFGF
jgi:hypothetical protein